MDFRAPETLIGINIADASQKTLVQQERFDPRAARASSLYEFFRLDFERIRTEIA